MLTRFTETTDTNRLRRSLPTLCGDGTAVARTISASPTDTEAAAGTIALADRVYAELVRALYASPVQAVYMAFIFTGYLALVLHAAPDAAILILGLMALAAWATRILTTVRLQRKALTAQLDRPAAKRLEMLFAMPYGSFAACSA
jgi:hypothetical protein